MRLCKDYAKESFLIFVNDKTLSSDNPLRFRKNLTIRSSKSNVNMI